ncbi:MAG: hypothetical protein ABL959_12570 [Pyrinomonadaceae bacterium]
MKCFLLLATILIGFSQAHAQKANPPADLRITQTLGGTERFGRYYEYVIRTDGRVTFDDRNRALPLHPTSSTAISPPKKPKRAKRLTDKQLMSLVREFEISGFFEMRDNYSYGDPTLTLQTCINHAEQKSLSITANGKTKSVTFFLGCSFSEKSPLKAFLALYDKVSQALSTVEPSALVYILD